MRPSYCKVHTHNANDSLERRRVQARASGTTGEMEGVYDLSMEVTLIKRPSRVSNICMEPLKRKWVTGAMDFSSFLHPKTPLSPDHKLLTLLHFNLIRALTRITLILGVNPDHMHLDIESPFHSAASNLSLSELPPNLRPTEMQLTVPHHPEVDIFPFPTFRDNMIVANNTLDDVEFCQDIVYGVDDGSGAPRNVDLGKCAKCDPSGRTGLIVWADPWFQSSWEVDVEFAKKYKGLFVGCEELINSTNVWRERRGEPPLDLN